MQYTEVRVQNPQRTGDELLVALKAANLMPLDAHEGELRGISDEHRFIIMYEYSTEQVRSRLALLDGELLEVRLTDSRQLQEGSLWSSSRQVPLR